MHAGDLRPGERVVTLPGETGSADSAVATVALVRVAPGAAAMDNLTVAQDHTYAVGDAQVVVHNEGCGGAYNSLDELANALPAGRRVIVIGRDMEGWVNPLADDLRALGVDDVHTWNPKDFENIQDQMEANRRWLSHWVNDPQNHAVVVDVGQKPGAVLRPSEYYDMEQRSIANWGADVFRYRPGA